MKPRPLPDWNKLSLRLPKNRLFLLAEAREREWREAVNWLIIQLKNCSVPCSGNDKCKDVSMSDIERTIKKAFKTEKVKE